jgi:hypothetical protein
MHRAAKRLATPQRWRVVRARRAASGWSEQPVVAALSACLERHAAIAEAVHDRCGAAAFADACPTVGASVGAHLRHSLEHVQCCATAVDGLRSGARTPILNYDGRERDAELERDPAYLAARSRELLNGIVHGDGVDLDAEVLAVFALDASGDDALLPSTLRRELAFAAHHATHHFFVAGLVAKSHLGLALPDDVGRAPATLRNDRQSASTGAYVDVGG